MDRNARPRRALAEKRWLPLVQGVCLVVGVLARVIEYILIWTGEKLCCAVHASPGLGSRRAPDSAGCQPLPPPTAHQYLLALSNANRFHALDRPVIAAAYQIHLFYVEIYPSLLIGAIAGKILPSVS